MILLVPPIIISVTITTFVSVSVGSIPTFVSFIPIPVSSVPIPLLIALSDVLVGRLAHDRRVHGYAIGASERCSRQRDVRMHNALWCLVGTCALFFLSTCFLPCLIPVSIPVPVPPSVSVSFS